MKIEHDDDDEESEFGPEYDGMVDDKQEVLQTVTNTT